MRFKYRLTIEYDGSPFQGWQIQEKGKTVQGVIEEALRDLTGERLEIQGASRTDAGVHALGQVAHFTVHRRWPTEKILFGLNDRLPATVNVLSVEEAPLSFHARRDAKEKVYLYCLSQRRTAFAKKYVWWVKDTLEVERICEGARLFVGLHDFSSFADKRIEPDVPRRVLISSCEVEKRGPVILFSVAGSHFLWKMVRRMVGVLVEIGRGNLPVEVIPSLLTTPAPLPARYTAPPSGLFLAQVRYEGEERRKIPWPPWGITEV